MNILNVWLAFEFHRTNKDKFWGSFDRKKEKLNVFNDAKTEMKINHYNNNNILSILIDIRI